MIYHMHRDLVDCNHGNEKSILHLSVDVGESGGIAAVEKKKKKDVRWDLFVVGQVDQVSPIRTTFHRI